MSRRRPTHRAPLRIVLTAAVHLGRNLTGASALLFAVGAVIYRDPRWLMCAGVFGAIALVLAFLHTFEAHTARCAVCSASVFSRTRCAKHKNAKRLLGSCRLHAATNIILFYRYRCQHCGELVLLDDGSERDDLAAPVAKQEAPAMPVAEIPPPAATQPPANAPAPVPSAAPVAPPQAIYPQMPAQPGPQAAPQANPAPATTPFELTPPA